MDIDNDGKDNRLPEDGKPASPAEFAAMDAAGLAAEAARWRLRADGLEDELRAAVEGIMGNGKGHAGPVYVGSDESGMLFAVDERRAEAAVFDPANLSPGTFLLLVEGHGPSHGIRLVAPRLPQTWIEIEPAPPSTLIPPPEPDFAGPDTLLYEQCAAVGTFCDPSVKAGLKSAVARLWDARAEALACASFAEAFARMRADDAEARRIDAERSAEALPLFLEARDAAADGETARILCRRAGTFTSPATDKPYFLYYEGSSYEPFPRGGSCVVADGGRRPDRRPGEALLPASRVRDSRGRSLSGLSDAEIRSLLGVPDPDEEE